MTPLLVHEIEGASEVGGREKDCSDVVALVGSVWQPLYIGVEHAIPATTSHMHNTVPVLYCVCYAPYTYVSRPCVVMMCAIVFV